MIYIEATLASLYSPASMQAIVSSFHVLGVFAFLADSMAWANYFKRTRQEAILALFLTDTYKCLAASYSLSS